MHWSYFSFALSYWYDRPNGDEVTMKNMGEIG